MSTGFLRNFDAANRYRQRRMQATLSGEAPVGGVITLDPGWDAFNGSLDDQAEAARAAGMNYRVDLSGLGARGTLGGSLPLYGTDAKQIATNVALSRFNDERKINDITIQNALDARGQDARNDLWSQYINQVQASEQPSAPMDVQKSVSPGQSDHYRIRPAVLSEEQQLARMDPLKRVAYQKEKAAMQLAEREQTRRDEALDLERDKTLLGGGGKPLTATAESNLLNRLTNQWTKATDSQNALTRSLSIMRTGLDRFEADPNGASQAVLVTFQKILDPESVVRESEYARSSQGISALARIRGMLERVQRGGAGVPKAELAEMVKTAEQFIENTKGASTSARKRIGATLDRYNLPHELVFSDGAPAEVSAPAGTPPAEAPNAVARNNPFRK